MYIKSVEIIYNGKHLNNLDTMKEAYNPYKKYGLRRVINAATCYTRLGGSISSPEIFKAMEDASKSFVQIPELQHWAGKKIAEATGAEAGLPTAGANNALMLAAAACMMKGTELEDYDPLELESWSHLILKLPAHSSDLKNEFVVQKNDRNSYDHAIECAGGRVVEVGSEHQTTERELEEGYDPHKTAAYYYTVRSSRRSLTLDKVIQVAHKHGVPVIVDAASELPPKDQLSRYVEKGADLVVFSGGKYLGGPNNSGILTGRRDLIKLAHLQAYPFHGVGRTAKMSRETIVGLVKALELYMEKDEEATFTQWEKRANCFAEQLSGLKGVETGVTYQRTVPEDEPMVPLCYLKLDEDVCGISGRDLVKKLREGDPSIELIYEPAFLLEDFKDKVTINPEFMLDGDELIVIENIKKLLNRP